MNRSVGMRQPQVVVMLAVCWMYTHMVHATLQGAHELQPADEEQLREHELSDDDDEFAGIMAAAAAAAGLELRSGVTISGDGSDDGAKARAAVRPRRPKKPKVSTKTASRGRGGHDGSSKGSRGGG